MQPRHEITKKYESNPRQVRRKKLTIEWLKQFDIKGDYLDCGDVSELTYMIVNEFRAETMVNTEHDLNKYNEREFHDFYKYNHIFAFEIIEHLLNPLNFMNFMDYSMDYNGSVYLSTPINRPKWMRNKEVHFHEFNYNELVFLIETSGFKIVNEKRINCTKWYYMFTGFRPFLRVLGIDKNILLRIKRK